MKSHLRARIVAEFLGTAFLVAAVVGSGIMAERLSAGNVALVLLANTIATGAALVALILTFGPISGAHLNPVVSLADAMEGGLAWSRTLPYIAAQISGGVCGTLAAHAMFGLPLVSLSRHIRAAVRQKRRFSVVQQRNCSGTKCPCNRRTGVGETRWQFSASDGRNDSQ